LTIPIKITGVTVPAGFPRYPTPVHAGDAARPWQSPFRWWWDLFSPRRVVFASPFPPSECSRRLMVATTTQVRDDYLRRLAGAEPRTRLIGGADPSGVRVAIPRERRRSPEPWLDGVIYPTRSGGSTLIGTAGVSSSRAIGPRVLTVLVAIVVVITVPIGVVTAVSGKAPGAFIFLLPGVLTALCVRLPR
jgi:hypothetical protein